MSTPMILNEKSQEDKMEGLATATNSFEVNPFRSLQDWNLHLIAKVGQQLALIERMNRLKRFLPIQIAETILNSDDTNLFESHRREITAVFLDLRGFTAFSDSAEPEEVMALLKNYHGEMGKLILKFNGTLEHFAGDGMMVFFNDPIPCEDHAEKAVCMGLEMRDKAKELRTGWLKNGCDLDLGIGVAAGYAVVGNIGFEGRMDYAAVGNVTNLAARLCGAAKGGQILTNQKTLSKIQNLVETEPLEELHLKGFARPVRAFNILNLKPNGDSKDRGC